MQIMTAVKAVLKLVHTISYRGPPVLLYFVPGIMHQRCVAQRPYTGSHVHQTMASWHAVHKYVLELLVQTDAYCIIGAAAGALLLPEY